MLTVGGLFSGIGGIERGLESTGGFRTVWHAEADDYCRRVLERHWPKIHIWKNVGAVQYTGEFPDVLAGGFPCQHISQAAARSARADGWLWPLFRGAIWCLRPRWVIIENTEALRYKDRGLSEVLGDLADLGFDAEWRVVRASDFGAPHKRARVWVVAHAYSYGKPTRPINDETPILSEPFPVISGWRVVPDLRVADVVPDRILRRERLGNSVAPPVAAWVGRCILAAEDRWMKVAA